MVEYYCTNQCEDSMQQLIVPEKKIQSYNHRPNVVMLTFFTAQKMPATHQPINTRSCPRWSKNLLHQNLVLQWRKQTMEHIG